MRRVLYISGSRADYGPARSTLLAIEADPELELGTLVTGMHLDPVHGETWQEIEQDGVAISDRVQGHVPGDSLATMAASIGLTLQGMSQSIERLAPDIVVVLGDRGEMLAGAVAAALQNIVVVHLCGGSQSGSIDDSIRHGITKFAHYHLVSCEAHAHRVLQMGERPESVRVVGLPGGDIGPDATIPRPELCAEYGLPIDRPYLLVIQHPVTHSREGVSEQIVETLEAVASSGHPTLLANPNDDAGGRVILQEMRNYAARCENMQILPPVGSRRRFASLMAHAGALVGNSSSGTVEAMSVALPVVNIGDRQRGRESTSCMLNVPHKRGSIEDAIREALEGKEYRRKLEAFASELTAADTPRQVARCLRELDLSVGSRPKDFVDHSLAGTAT